MKLIALCFIVIIVSSSCTNKYERQLVGNYESHVNYSDSIGGRTIYLNLFQSNKYDLILDSGGRSGTWTAGDNGDWTWIRFDDAVQLDGRVFGRDLNIINILNPSMFCCPGVDSLRFEKMPPAAASLPGPALK